MPLRANDNNETTERKKCIKMHNECMSSPLFFIILFRLWASIQPISSITILNGQCFSLICACSMPYYTIRFPNNHELPFGAATIGAWHIEPTEKCNSLQSVSEDRTPNGNFLQFLRNVHSALIHR